MKSIETGKKIRQYELEKNIFRPVCPLVIALISGIILGTNVPGYNLPAYFIVAVSLALILLIIFNPYIKKTGFLFNNFNLLSFIVACLKKNAVFKTGRTAIPLLCYTALGYILIQPWSYINVQPNNIINYEDTHRWEIFGIIQNRPLSYNNRLKFNLKVTNLAKNGDAFPVTGMIRVTVYGKCQNLFVGDGISFKSKIRSINNFKNPGRFDYKRHMLFSGISGSSSVTGKKIVRLKKNKEKKIIWLIENVRIAVSELIEKMENTKHKGILKALIIGEKNEISKINREAFNRAGIGHILAISGLHIGIIASFSFILFKWILSFNTFLLWNAQTKKISAILSLFPVFVYGLLSGMSPSTQRAIIMVSVFMLTFVLANEQDIINTLSFAALIILIIKPTSVYLASFQLSFSAVFFIILGLNAIKSRFNNLLVYKDKAVSCKYCNRMLTKVAILMLVSFFAILGSLPFTMLYFNQISIVSIFSNLIFVPVIGFAVVPLGLFALFLYPASTWAALLFLKVSGKILDHAVDIAISISKLPFASYKTVTPNLIEITIYYILLLSALYIIGSPNSVNDKAKNRATIKRKKIALIAAIVALLAICLDVLYWMSNRLLHDDLKVTIIDVGQGSAALAELPCGFNMMIDGGGFSDNMAFDMGKRVIAPFLWTKKIKTVDVLILSHPNSDHLNGLIYIARHFNVKSIWTNNEKVNTVGYNTLMQVIKKNNIKMPAYSKLPKKIVINGVNVNILYPSKNFLNNKKKSRWRNTNNNSLVVQLKHGSKSFLFTGDINSKAEKELVGLEKDNIESYVLIVPHHGSKTSSSALLIKKVKPVVAVISAGYKNKFRFPDPTVLNRYKKAGCQIFRTDIHGAITFTIDSNILEIHTFIN